MSMGMARPAEGGVSVERYSDEAIRIIDELHTERLDYNSEYLPLIDAAQLLAAYEDTGLTPQEMVELKARIEGQWIPCSSGVMPDAEQEVRVICKTSTGYRYQCLAVYIPTGVYREDSGYSWDWECCEEYNEERDDYMVNPGWYESIHNWDDYNSVGIADTVTHWMPLSEMPEEG